MAIKIYTMQGCPWCKKAKDWLNEKGVEYEEVDITDNESAQKEMMDKSGARGVPQVDFDGKMIVGFVPEEYEKAFGSGNLGSKATEEVPKSVSDEKSED